jgi:ABC-type glycerol-3-phosphate transport system substrate-binding protein
MAPLPRDAQSLTQGTVEGYAIYAQTEHPDACWQWITFLGQQMSPDGEHLHRLIPARRSVAESKAYEQLVGEEVATTAQVSTEGLVLINFAVFAEFGDAMGMFEDAIGEIIDEGADPQQVMTGIQQQLEGAGP